MIRFSKSVELPAVSIAVSAAVRLGATVELSTGLNGAGRAVALSLVLNLRYALFPPPSSAFAAPAAFVPH